MGLIELCTNHTGKMEGIKSLSTSVLLNPNCQKNRLISGSICSHCYANALAQMYASLGARLERNTKELTSRSITIDDTDYLKTELKDEKIFRFEAFGDLNNETQLINYLKICLTFPHIQFALYTKMYKLVYEYFRQPEHICPSNLVLILSSLEMNRPITSDRIFYALGKFYDGQVKIFTVYDKEYIRTHPGLNINCGARSCNTCRICYLKNNIKNVNEILKSDRDAATMIVNFQDPVKRCKIIANVEKIMKEYKGGR